MAEQRGVEPKVGLGKVVAGQERPAVAEPRVKPLQSVEKGAEGLGIDRLIGGETGLVGAVVDRVVDVLVQPVDLRPQVGIVGVEGRAIGGGASQRVRVAVEHADDFGAFVVDDAARTLVVEDGHGLFRRTFGKVEFPGQPVALPGSGILGAFGQRLAGQRGYARRVELPQTRTRGVVRAGAVREGHVHRDAVAQPKHAARQRHAMAPRTVQCHVEVITALFRRKVRVSDCVAKPADAPHEFTAGAAHLCVGLILFDRVLGH